MKLYGIYTVPTSNTFNVISDIQSSSQNICLPAAPLTELTVISHSCGDSLCFLRDIETNMLSRETSRPI